MNVIQRCYKLVLNLSDLLHEYNFDETKDPEFLKYTSKTIIATNVTQDDIKKVFTCKLKHHRCLRDFIIEYMEWHQRKSSLNQSQVLLYGSYVFSYLKSVFMHKLHNLVGSEICEFLLMNCDFYEDLYRNNKCYRQRFGFLLSRHAWSKTEFEEIRAISVKNENLEHCLKGINLTVKTKKAKRENRLDKREECAPDDSKPREICRRLMFYSPTKNWKNRKSQFFFIKNKLVKGCDLFQLIFTEEERFYIDDSCSIASGLQEIIEKHSKCKYKNLVDFSCKTFPPQVQDKESLKYRSSHFEVCEFIRRVFTFVFPVSLFGGRNGHTLIYKGLKLLVKCGVNATITLSDIRGVNFDVSRCEWLKCVLCDCKRKRIFDSFLKWITAYFINVLKLHFYITETGATKMETCFFRHDVWCKLCEMELNDMQKEGRITETDSKDNIEVFTLRFLPKSRGLRKLVYSNKNNPKQSITQSTRKNLFALLREIRQSNGWKNACSNNLHEMVKRQKESKCDKVYWLRADISQCFSSINQKKLFNIVSDQIVKLFPKLNSITFKEFEMVTNVGKRLNSKRIRCIAQSMSSFCETVRNKDCVIIESKYESVTSLDLVKEQLAGYILSPVIKSKENGKHYVMKKGIREGGTLSTELALIFVNSILDAYFGDLGLGHFEHRMTQTDDIILITCDERRYKEAVRIITNGFEEWDIRLNPEKLVLNPEVNGYRFSEELLFDGRLLNVNTLNCRTDYSHYADKQIDYSFSCNPFNSLDDISFKLSWQIVASIAYIDVDCGIMSEEMVALNIYEKFTLQTHRLQAFFKLSPNFVIKQQPKFILKSAFRLSRRFWLTVTNWSSESIISFTLSETEIQCICLMAMKDVWRSRASNRGVELRALKESLKIIKEQVSTEKYELWTSKFITDVNSAFQSILRPWN